MRKRRRVPLIRQEGRNDCGSACLSSISRYYGLDLTLELACDLCETSRSGTSLRNLSEAARQLGFESEAYLVDSMDELNRNFLPLILHVEKSLVGGHFIILWAVLQKGATTVFKCMDPAQGYVELDGAQLNQIWKSRTCLHLVPGKGFQPNRLRYIDRFNWVRSLLKEDGNHFFSIFSIGVVMAVSSVLITLFVQKMVDDYVPNSGLHEIQTGLISLLMLLLFKEYLSRIRLKLIHRLTAIFNGRMFDWFNRKLLSLPGRYFDSHTIGDFSVRFQDAQKVQRMVFNLFNSILVDLLFLIILLIILVGYDVFIGAALAGFCILYLWIFWLVSRPIQEKQYAVIKSNTRFEERFINAYLAVKAFKLFRKEEWIADRIRLANEKLQGIIRDYGFTVANLGFLSAMLTVPALLCTIYYVANRAITGDISLGEMVSIIGFVSLLFPLMANLASSIIPLKEATLAFNRLSEFNILSMSVPEDRKGISCIEKICFEGVHPLSQNKSDATVNLTVKKGELVLITGSNGAGKTSLLNILSGLRKTYRGTIWVNDHLELRAIDMESWLDRIAMVPQEIPLFDGTVLENIAFEQAHAKRKELVEFLEKENFMQFFGTYPNGVDSLMGQLDLRVSGGHRQLIGLARALYHPSDLLLLDEVTNALDHHALDFVMSQILKVKKDRLVLLVSHNADALMKMADHVLEIK